MGTHDHHMIMQLTSESLQTQTPPSHIHANYLRVYPDSITELRVTPDPQLIQVVSTTIQRVRCPLLPPNQYGHLHDQQLITITKPNPC